MKKLAIGFAVLVILIAGAFYYLHLNLDSIVKSAIEKYGSAAAHTAVRVSSVKLSPTTGEGALNGLSVRNPEGFSSADALSLGLISVKVDTSSLSGNGPIIIREIVIEKPNVIYEATIDGGSNLQTLEGKVAQPATPTSNASSAPARKVVIKDLYIRNGQIQITHPLLQGKLLTTSLPLTHLTNIGQANGGVTPTVIADLLIKTIVVNAHNVATQDLMKNISALPGVVKGTPSNILNQVNGLIGK